jgi:hypothetical protein
LLPPGAQRRAYQYQLIGAYPCETIKSVRENLTGHWAKLSRPYGTPFAILLLSRTLKPFHGKEQRVEQNG